MYVKVKDGEINQYPYSIDLLKSENPNTSFPKDLTEEVLNAFGIFSVDHQAQPEYDNLTQRIEHSSEPVLVNGKWVITKTVVNLTPEQITMATNSTAKSVRDKRNKILAESDWTQVLDAPVDQSAWGAYRQALRDITTHSNFPYLTETDWPTKPE